MFICYVLPASCCQSATDCAAGLGWSRSRRYCSSLVLRMSTAGKNSFTRVCGFCDHNSARNMSFRDLLTGPGRSRTARLLSRFSVTRHAQNERSIRSRTLKSQCFTAFRKSTSQRRSDIRVDPGRVLLEISQRRASRATHLKSVDSI